MYNVNGVSGYKPLKLCHFLIKCRRVLRQLYSRQSFAEHNALSNSVYFLKYPFRDKTGSNVVCSEHFKTKILTIHFQYDFYCLTQRLN